MRSEIQAGTSTILAGRVGRYRETMALPALRQHFRCVWTHLIPENHAGPVAVVPDGCVDLLWRDGRFAAVGPDISASHPVLQPGATVIGLRFQPGAASRWLGLPMTEIIGTEVDMQDLWGRTARDVAEMMQEAPGSHARAGLLQELMLRAMPAVEPPARDAAAIFGLLQKHSGSEGGKIAMLRDELHLSERTLRRRSRYLFGYGPKTLDRILRFQKFQEMARTAGPAGLADMALAAGYADQAHLNREIQALCGMTAATFVRQIALE